MNDELPTDVYYITGIYRPRFYASAGRVKLALHGHNVLKWRDPSQVKVWKLTNYGWQNVTYAFIKGRKFTWK